MGESRYEWVQRRRREGTPVEALAEELMAEGLDSVEIDRLLDRNAPVVTPQPLGGDAMASPQLVLGMVLVVAGLMALASGRFPWLVLFALVAGVSRIARAWGMGRPTKAQQHAARLAMLGPAEAQCARHPGHAAMGTCPRCGAFCCARCTPGRGFGGGRLCVHCQAMPEMRALRRRRAASGAALTLLSGPSVIVLLLAVERVRASTQLAPTTTLAVMLGASAPWLLLAAVQSRVLSSWPTVVSLVPWLASAAVLLRGDLLGPALWLVPLGAVIYGWVSMRQAAQVERAWLDD